MTTVRKVLALAFASTLGSTTLTFAGGMTPEKQADARTKVETAVALANIAKADKDGEAMLVAARMLAEAGPVAEQGAKMKDGKPTLIDTGKMAKMAKEMGADAKKADAVASTATSNETARSDGYWYYSCDSYNNCQWIYAGY
ncbi:hypothetical protein BPNPMPFG_001183 [Mesorhizobium sp. AR07]|uniref:hypothetical protein n=1 Tax=Mesorhizobium sp. AR07 TaxID=2865838 RepID=UPI00215E65B0|nr:hypothetical protein [Mesorhizobium sp. AR07]UVK45629.1 hypothetical protein BPNPMPFG_001183 [Mesorhizobium sp. AR07]